MHPLLWLLVADSRSALRGLARKLRRPRGALAASGLLLFCAIVANAGRSGIELGENLLVYGPPALVALVLLGAFSPLGLYYRPADVHWLLPAPLERWELVLFNVAVRARPAVFSGLLLSVLPAWRVDGWWPAFSGYTLVFLLLQVSAQWIAGMRAWLAQLLAPAARRAIGAALVGLPAAAVALELNARPELSFREFAIASSTLAAIGAPTRPFLATIASGDAATWLASALLSTAILAAGVAHLCVMRIPFRETALAHSERHTRRFTRMRVGGGAFGAASTRHARRVPMFPRLGGAGPVAWRQLQELVRNPRGVLMISAIVAIVISVTIAAPLLRGGDPELVVRLGRTGIFLAAMLPLLMGENLACDFRRDLERMGQLKSWPVAPLALAVGQIAPAALIVTGIQAAGIAVLVATTGAVPVPVAWLIVALLPVVSWVAVSIDNLFFLWMPYRTTPEDPGDVGFVGRTFATALFKFVWIAGILGATIALGWAALYLTRSPWGALGVPVAALLGSCWWCTSAVAYAFERFDLARDAVA